MSNYFVVITYFLFQAPCSDCGVANRIVNPSPHSSNRDVATYKLPDRRVEKNTFCWIRLVHEICYLLVASYSVNIVELLKYVIPCSPDAMGHIGENGISQEK